MAHSTLCLQIFLSGYDSILSVSSPFQIIIDILSTTTQSSAFSCFSAIYYE